MIRARYGIGIEGQLSGEAVRVVEELRSITMRSIHKLSAELYGGNAHFLLELMQNADDSQFELGTEPLVTIDVCEQSVTFHCNEARL